MPRITEKLLTEVAATLRNEGRGISINWMNGFCHVREPLPNGGHNSRTNGTNAEVYRWLCGFSAGIAEQKERDRKALVKARAVLLDELEQRQIANMPSYEKPVREALGLIADALKEMP